ncbi:hypothetical protein PPEP_b0158 [Pseudoalteromonas peptidolytica F12-50-A1]|uniref:Uncharacterized protein n=1 Tax=Pseudoalteromonas peptidolytica F12-50-A1 TaxID=1315280 RepID=A0A8I0T6L6_9GAMM|nr:hypothetical protein [Pseudoalteromonas peptidolytica F12-50-A1]
MLFSCSKKKFSILLASDLLLQIEQVLSLIGIMPERFHVGYKTREVP